MEPVTEGRGIPWRRALRWAAIVVASALVLFLLTPTGRYLARAAWEEAKILARRRPIAAIIADGSVDERTRAKLALVLEARRFARDSLRLDVDGSFTTFSRLDRDTLVLVLSAAHRDRLKRYTWWFPIVGRVPYKGFFDFDAARAALAAMDSAGFDTYLRPAAAFSTLGWFDDPLLPTTLREDSLDLVNTVVHELTHSTFYAGGEAIFNESFANFAGARGAAAFYRSRGDTAAAREVEARWSDEKVLGAFWTALYRELDSAFAANPGSRAARLAARERIFAAARDRLVHEVGPRLRTIGPRALERARMDNAALLARRVYLTDLELFDAVWVREGRDARRAIRRVIELAKANDDEPFDGLRSWLAADPVSSR